MRGGPARGRDRREGRGGRGPGPARGGDAAAGGGSPIWTPGWGGVEVQVSLEVSPPPVKEEKVSCCGPTET